MTIESKKKVFISYSWSDNSTAIKVKEVIPHQFDVWIDKEKIAPGDEISSSIQKALSASDYYVILISETSNNSTWVRREIATAFDLANQKMLSVVPVLLQGADIPLEFRGLLYIDFRPSLQDGLSALKKFFVSQISAISDIEPRHKILKSQNENVGARINCNESLRKMSLGDLRHLVSERLSLEEVEVVWYDLFHRRMVDEVQIKNVALSSVELIDRSRRTDVLVELMDTLCRNFPHVSKGI